MQTVDFTTHVVKCEQRLGNGAHLLTLQNGYDVPVGTDARKAIIIQARLLGIEWASFDHLMSELIRLKMPLHFRYTIIINGNGQLPSYFVRPILP